MGLLSSMMGSAAGADIEKVTKLNNYEISEF